MPLGHRTRTQTMSSADFRPLSPSSCRSTSRKQFFLKKICKLLKRIKILELKKQAFSDPLLQYNRFLLSLSERIIVTRMISTRTSTEQTLTWHVVLHYLLCSHELRVPCLDPLRSLIPTWIEIWCVSLVLRSLLYPYTSRNHMWMRSVGSQV
jgi:hypothetical protein